MPLARGKMASLSMRNSIEKRGYGLKHLTTNDIREIAGPVRLNLIALCHQGEFVGSVNLQTIELHAGTRVCLPNVFHLTVDKISEDFRATVLAVDPKLSLNVISGISTEHFDCVFATPVRHIDNPHEWKMLNDLIDSIDNYMTIGTDDRTGGGVVPCIYRSLLLLIAEMELCHGDGAIKTSNYSMRDIWYRKFLLQLDKHVEVQREVQFYADMVGVSPKYLNMICKQKTGRKAKEIISIVLLSRLKMDMTITTLNMKQIADKYNFADMSSFGKFFKKMTGMSPRDFRTQ